MTEKKRQRTTTTSDECDDDDKEMKKFKYISSLPTQTINTDENSLTQFENLTNMNISEIFQYLHTYDIYKGFFDLNIRFRNLLLLEPTMPIKLTSSFISKSTFQRYYTDFIQSNKPRIHSLDLSNPFILDFFSSSTTNISTCSQLRTVRIPNGIPAQSLENLLINLASLPHFSSLSVHVIPDSNKITIYQLIFQLPALKYCQISFEEKLQLKTLPLCTNSRLSPIEYLSIDDNYNLDEIDTILSYVSQLRRLSVKHKHGRKSAIFLMILNNRTHISVIGDRLRFDNIGRFMNKYASQIKMLQVLMSGRSLNDKWTKSILSYVPNLRIFNFNKEYQLHCARFKEVYLLVGSSRAVASSQIRQWAFTHEPMSEEYLHETFCSILPYRRNFFTIIRSWWLSSCPYHSHAKTDYNSIQHLVVEEEYVFLRCSKHFPNVTELTLADYCHLDSKNFAEVVTRQIISLNRLTKLTINSLWSNFHCILDMLSHMPNLETLSFTFDLTDKHELSLLDTNETFRLVSNQNKIQHVIIQNHCTLQAIKLLMTLCPQLEQLTFSVPRQVLEQCVEYLLMETNKTTCHLFSLCLVKMNTKQIETLQTLIESKQLLRNYSSQTVYDKFYLWW